MSQYFVRWGCRYLLRRSRYTIDYFIVGVKTNIRVVDFARKLAVVKIMAADFQACGKVAAPKNADLIINGKTCVTPQVGCNENLSNIFMIFNYHGIRLNWWE